MSAPLFAPPPPTVARVALPLPIDQLFDYAVPADLASRALPGSRVRVQAGSRHHTGVIVETGSSEWAAGTRERERLREIEAVLDDEPVLSASLLTVLREEAEQLLCPIGIALAAALPAGSSPRTRREHAITARGREALERGAIPAPARPLLEALAKGPRPSASLRRKLGADVLGPLPDLERDGLVETRQALGPPAVRAARVRMARLAGPESGASELGERAHRQTEIAAWLAEHGPSPTAALGARFPGAAATLRRLEAKGLVVIEDHDPVHAPGALFEEDRTLTLSPEQSEACEAIGTPIVARQAELFLLHGVTGSGKTEVYLRVVARALEAGRQALVLVPEITLTHQIVARLRARFGDQLAILHSGLRPAERLAQWERLRRGDTPIAVGARSALFAPTRDLGVIVVDEEHDAAYKNEEGFRYHARTLAARRAQADGCPLVLGSATPSLETRFAAERGRVRRLRLPHRMGGSPLPAVTLIDLAAERSSQPRGRKLVLSTALRRGLSETLAEGGQSILFLNRRGFSTQIACFDCGHVVRCKDCDISLTFHAASDRLCCHYCDYRIRPPEACPGCGGGSMALLGLGTERVEEEVRTALPGARVARLDRDVSARRGATEEVLGAIAHGEIDVLVGTQMIAKGHDFPGVGLVGVINADLGLHFPDFRAAERTFQLLTQVAGRAGRAKLPGRVLIQTYQPDHEAIRPVVHHDYESFYARELEQRRLHAYPPFGRIALVRISGTDEGLARIAAERLARAAREAPGASAPPSVGDAMPAAVLGPAPAPIARLRGRYRFQVLLKHPRASVLREVARAVQAAVLKLPSDARASIDLQPLDML